MQATIEGDDVLLHERDAARFLNISVAWLQKHRCRGTGPSFIRIGGRKGGAVRYRRSDLERWIEINRTGFPNESPR